ncbi:multicopper oxidase family protein [Candidatus Wolfebacteria bacterium]|nr:multicopper oxidase family protein [Candidatus Wolfebacteria bacterium]
MTKKILPIIIVAAFGAISGAIWQINKINPKNYLADISSPKTAQAQIIELKDGDTFNLEASVIKKNINGQNLEMLAYNGSIPGPTIKVKKGSQITLNLINKTGLDTTLHPHGIRLENEFDGVPGITQKPIENEKSFAYKIKFPDEGVFIYHPHVRTDISIEKGLYGNFIVYSDDIKSAANQEIALMLDDILIDQRNGKIVPFSDKFSDFALMGRYGNTMLINGETNYRLEAKTGETLKLYLTNIANTRTFNFSIADQLGNKAKIKLIGSDLGNYEKEKFVENIILAPAERAVVEIFFEKPGKYKIENKIPENNNQENYVLGEINVLNDKTDKSFVKEFLTLKTDENLVSEINGLKQYFSAKPDKKIRLGLDMGAMAMHAQHMAMMGGGKNEKIEWEDPMPMMNAMLTSQYIKWKLIDEDSKKENMDINWQFNASDKFKKIQIFNDPNSPHPMQHPIHFHGQRFLILSVNGVKNENLAWKDTILVENGDSSEILLDISNPGDWVAHCHILEHAESGMMMKYKVL